MSHCDQDTLSLLALGESSSPEDAAHVMSCAQCQHQLDALRSVVTTARSELGDILIRDDDGRDVTEGSPVIRITPPERVWQRIAAATGVSTQARAGVVARGGDPHLEQAASPSIADTLNGVPVSSPLVPADASDPTGSAAPAGTGRDAPAPPGPPAVDAGARSAQSAEDVPAPMAITRPRRAGRPRPARRDGGTLIGIAAVALIVGVLGGFGVSSWVQNGTRTVTSPTVVAGTALSGLSLAPAAAGDATVVQTANGRRLDVDVRRLNPQPGFYQVWLISSDVTRMVSVGVLQGRRGDFALPADLDLSQFPLVDISIQTYDDKGAHSGKSVLRGTLNI